MVNSGTTSIVGKRLSSAVSSLTGLALGFDDGTGLLVEAVQAEETPLIKASVISVLDLPKLEEAVCTVDWGWIIGSTITNISLSCESLRFKLDPAGPLNVSVGKWQGKPFLTFMPYRSPVKL